jgi:hypothetical protein
MSKLENDISSLTESMNSINSNNDSKLNTIGRKFQRFNAKISVINAGILSPVSYEGMKNRAIISAFLAVKRPVVALITETTMTQDEILNFQGYRKYHAYSETRENGVVVLIQEELEGDFTKTLAFKGRLVYVYETKSEKEILGIYLEPTLCFKSDYDEVLNKIDLDTTYI